MCIIVAKEKNVELPSKETLRRCFNKNPDGSGMMFVDKGKVCIRKGFMTFDEFYNYLIKMDSQLNFKNKSLVMHFRISTGGNVDEGNCHPYPITSNVKKLRKTSCMCDVGMVHNGVISSYSNMDKVLNDTQMFVKNMVSTFHMLDKDFCKNEMVLNALDDIIGWSRLCFLTDDDNLYYVGEFIEDNGVKYSNDGYLNVVHNRHNIADIGHYDNYYYDHKSKSWLDKDLMYGIIEDKIKNNSQEPLTKYQFDMLLDELILVEQGDSFMTSDGIFEIDDDFFYGLDRNWNLYYIDYDKENIILLYNEVGLPEMYDDFNETY